MKTESRQILHSSSRVRDEVGNLLQMIFVAELVRPGKELWLVSPWISDVEVVDNRTGAFQFTTSDLPNTRLRLSDVLSQAARNGTRVTVVTRPDVSDSIVETLKRSSQEALTSGNLRIVEREALHTKGLLGDDFCLSGSMNFTFSGLFKLDEMLSFVIDLQAVSQIRLAFREEYGVDE